MPMRLFFLLMFLMASGTVVFSQPNQAFITDWVATGGTITIPTTGTGYNYSVTWTNLTNPGVGNGNVTGQQANCFIPNLQIGATYRISITGIFPRIFMAYGNQREKIRNIVQWGSNPWKNMALAFLGCHYLKLTATDMPNLNAVQDMRWMFGDCFSFTASNSISNWNTSNVQDMSYMFSNASFFNQNLGNWNVSSVYNMAHMLDYTKLSVTNYDATLIGWAGQSVQPGIYFGASGLKYCAGQQARNTLVDTSEWNIIGDSPNGSVGCVPFVTTWRATGGTITIPTFQGENYNYNVICRQISPNTGNIITVSGQNGNCMIEGLIDSSIHIYEISISGAFPRFYMGWNNPERTKLRTIKQWGTQAWTSMNEAFYGCSNMTYQATDAPNLSNVTDLSSMFVECVLFNGNIGNWNTSNIKNMSYMFYWCLQFNQNIGNWNTSNVTDMSSMFVKNIMFNQDIGNWNTSNVTEMWNMFQMSAFNQDISFKQTTGAWNTSKVINMQGMFGSTHFNQDISNWNTENVKFMGSMFDSNTFFNQPIGNWNTENVLNMTGMFSFASAFNQDLSHWKIDNVITMRHMFSNAISFNQDLSNWNTSSVTDMAGMFTFAKSFNQNIGMCNIANVVTMDSMLNKCGILKDNYDATLMGWASQAVQPNIILGSLGLNYCASISQRNDLINVYNWTIIGDNHNCMAARMANVPSSANSLESVVSLPENNNKINIYPNPSQGDFNIESNADVKNTPYTIYNSQGSEMLKGILENSNANVKTNLTSGIYFIHISRGEKTIIKKMVINK